MSHVILQAINTKYLGPSNVRGSRVKATAAAGTKTIEWDDALTAARNHERAAHELARKFKWNPRALVGGGLKDGSYVWVQIDDIEFTSN